MRLDYCGLGGHELSGHEAQRRAGSCVVSDETMQRRRDKTTTSSRHILAADVNEICLEETSSGRIKDVSPPPLPATYQRGFTTPPLSPPLFYRRAMLFLPHHPD